MRGNWQIKQSTVAGSAARQQIDLAKGEDANEQPARFIIPRCPRQTTAQA